MRTFVNALVFMLRAAGPLQGMGPAASGEYRRLPWRPALLTRTNSTC
ncbi:MULTISPECIES: hypothetical protein [Streptomyces]|nr:MULTISPECIES: hypothetical protein [Streptomyces]MYS89118.1 hypothetical protein [Streptomyces sp. SID5464]